MRKFKVLALALVIGTVSLFATNRDNLKEPTKKIRNQIENLLQASIENIEDEMTVNITFTFSSEGEIVVLKVDTKNRDILNYVRENLNYKKIKTPGVTNKLYTFPLKLKAE
ncbi:MAG: hypothetical protein QM495_05405 [Lutibacter sp.]|uniref:hypothetical protein n=1 Tax=Lutibacter sp. TaxID=1925666 RepID=UPI00385FEF00